MSDAVSNASSEYQPPPSRPNEADRKMEEHLRDIEATLRTMKQVEAKQKNLNLEIRSAIAKLQDKVEAMEE